MFFRKKHTDSEIIRGLINHEDSVFRYLQIELRPIINQLVFSNSGFRQDAEEHYTDTIMLVLKNVKAGKFDLNRGSFKAYFRTIAWGLWIDKLRKRNKNVRTTLLEEWHSNTLKFSLIISEDEVQLKLERILLDCIKKMSAKEQKMIKQKFYDNLSYNEIASNLGYGGSGSARVKMDRIKKQLKKMIKESSDPDIKNYWGSTKIKTNS